MRTVWARLCGIRVRGGQRAQQRGDDERVTRQSVQAQRLPARACTAPPRAQSARAYQPSRRASAAAAAPPSQPPHHAAPSSACCIVALLAADTGGTGSCSKQYTLLQSANTASAEAGGGLGALKVLELLCGSHIGSVGATRLAECLRRSGAPCCLLWQKGLPDVFATSRGLEVLYTDHSTQVRKRVNCTNALHRQAMRCAHRVTVYAHEGEGMV